jgi:hypothetical protein
MSFKSSPVPLLMSHHNHYGRIKIDNTLENNETPTTTNNNKTLSAHFRQSFSFTFHPLKVYGEA